MIDRITSTQRPAGEAAGWQKWRQLLFVHWEVPVGVMRAAVPKSMELDLWEGRAFVGVVPFSMIDVRPRWLPRVPFRDGMSFLECNVRTYVVVNGEPGVYFFSLEAASMPAVVAARATFGLPYFWAEMSSLTDEGVTRYSSRRIVGGEGDLEVSYRLGERLGPSQPGTLEHFLLERYLLFVERFGRLVRAQVHHTAYPAQRAELVTMRDGLVEAAGILRVSSAPAYVHYASGVDVEVFAPRAIAAVR